MEDKNYTVQEVADILGVHITKVYRLIELGELGAYDISTQKNVVENHRPNWRIAKTALASFMEARKFEGK